VPEPDLVALFAGPLHRSGALHIPTGLKADFYPSQNDPFFAWAWEKKKPPGMRTGRLITHRRNM
jgi:hypothetical protein